MSTAKRSAIVILVSVTALAAGYWYVTKPQAPSTDLALERERLAYSDVSPRPGDIDVQPFHANPMVVAAPDSSPLHDLTTEPLPSQDIPFSEQAPALAEMVAKGHPTAACRLFVGVSRCTFHAARRNFARRMEHSVGDEQSRGDDELFIRAISHSQGRDSDTAGCDGVSTASMPKPDDYLAQATARMSARQKVLLAMMRADGTVVRLPRQPDPVIRPGRNSSYLIPQFLADNSLRFLHEGVAAADPLALEGLILVHAPGFLPGTGNGMNMAIPDPRRFAHHALLMQTVYGPETLGPFVEEMLGQTLASMSPDMLQQVEESVAATAAAWNLNIAEPLTLEGPAVGDAEPLCTAR